MQLDQALNRVAVVGAGGKMGRGIALLLLQEVARREADIHGFAEKPSRRIVMIDSSEVALSDLRHYLQQQIIHYAERNINDLRRFFSYNPNIVSNEEVIATFIEGAFDMVLLETEVSAAREATMVFEAIVEDVDAKVELFKNVKSGQQQFFFTNTSSIPIHVLSKKAELKGQIIGFHFYNPPAVQRLVELIAPNDVGQETKQLALDLAQCLGKTVIESADVAGFIGNGHFMREIVFASQQVEELSKRLPIEEAIYLINRITGDYLVRPMGIFHLIDFVGVDVVQRILKTMQAFQHDKLFHSDLIDRMVAAGAVGGVREETTLCDGFFQYASNKPIGVYCIDKKKYRAFGEWTDDVKRALGPVPQNYHTWKSLLKDADKQKKIEAYFERLFESQTPASEVTVDFLMHSRDVADGLVRDGIAKNRDAVNQVLTNGFYHLYGADIPWFNFEHVFRNNICDV